jgi:galactonate dehydratase
MLDVREAHWRIAGSMAATSRRRFLVSTVGTFGVAGALENLSAMPAASRRDRLTDLELLPVRATEQTVWLFVRLKTNSGLTGLGEASGAVSYFNTSRRLATQHAARMKDELTTFFQMVEGRSPLEITRLRKFGLPRAQAGGLVSTTAFSAIEQAMWDLSGKLLEQPVCNLLGGKLREHLPVYANINRAAKPRTPAGFAASATKAVAEGFRAVKLAPFDGFKRQDFSDPAKSKPVTDGIGCVAAVRDAVGNNVAVMVDGHSLFDVPLGIEIAQRLEPYRLARYEEPIAPTMISETNTIRRAIKTELAGGEMLFGMKGFADLCRSHAVDVIMPDVKHCGGLLELTHIAALAEMEGIAVAPHNPSGPVSTAASVQVSAVLSNFRILELQWGEVEWRGEIVTPHEQFDSGRIRVSEQPGCGVSLNEQVVKKYAL